MIVGTAGHIDHGKTALVKALTGVDTDRLKEEKARGISIELGFAYKPLGDKNAAGSTDASGVLGFVDVPGHERFVHHMIAGATGIDFVLLVIAADDGPMPQTREHLQILELLGLSRGVVALSKADRVSVERLRAAEGEVRAALAGSAFANVDIVPVSALEGTGVDALMQRIAGEAKRVAQRPAAGRFRLAIDRSFTLAGVGTVVTGTVFAGEAKVGDRLLVSPGGREVRVRSIHAQNRAAQAGRAGERCALNIAGPQFEKKNANRGDWVLDPAAHSPSSRIDVMLRLLPSEARSLRHLSTVHVHLGAAHLTGRVGILEGDSIEPGGEALVQLLLARPVGALAGDRVILRDAAATRTIGGGRVLDPFPPLRGSRRPERLAWLRAWADGGPQAALAAGLAQSKQAIDLARLALAANLRPEEASALFARLPLVRVKSGDTDLGFSRDAWNGWREAVLATLGAEHRRAPRELGPEREALRKKAAPDLGAVAFGALLDALRAEGLLTATGSWIHLPAHRVALAEGEERDWQAVRPLLEAKPLAPPRIDQIARQLGWKEQRVKALLHQLAKIGEVCIVSEERGYTRKAVRQIAAVVKKEAAGPEGVTAAQLRDAIGIGRNLVIDLLEFFDRVGFTRRVKDSHKLRDPQLFD
jgi:selenocysteine-specific elongation factor